MRQLKVTAHQFDNFVYPHVANGLGKGDGDWEAGGRLLRKFKDSKLTREKPLTPDEVKAKAEGRAVYPFRRLVHESAVFLLQDDEYRIVKEKVKGMRDHTPLYAADDFDAAWEAIEAAEEFEPEIPEATPDEEPEA